MSDEPRRIVFALYPDLTQLDFTGPHQVLSRLPGHQAIVASRAGGAIPSEDGLVFADTVALASVPDCAVLCVPGGLGFTAAIEDQAYMDEIVRLAATADYVTSVCTGSLILGAAGLLRGRRAACHWGWRYLLPAYGASPDDARVVRDGHVVTGGGVTAGIDFALVLAAEIVGAETAQAIQLGLEYAPAPPFGSGRPETAPAAVFARAEERFAKVRAMREDVVARSATRLAKASV